MIVAIYVITGFYGTRQIHIIECLNELTQHSGPSFWEQKFWTFTHLDHIPIINKLPNLPLNESFMVFGAIGLAFNIFTRFGRILDYYIFKLKLTSSYMNVRRSTLNSSTKSHHPPLLLLLPFVFAAAVQVAWLSQPEYNHSHILHSATFVPFLCAWGLQFAHQVGRMILAHITSTPFPLWDWLWIWSVIGAVDANMPHLLSRYDLIRCLVLALIADVCP